eukprot:INCI14707.6.p1 GENE.INCI14707.6~~INCI14707.6.p1  ORF type:complete len:317 (+),score=36.97 INCI14707.6:392-1342(+)
MVLLRGPGCCTAAVLLVVLAQVVVLASSKLDQRLKMQELRELCQEESPPGYVQGIFDAGLLSELSSVDWIDWIRRHSDVLVGDGKYCRRVYFTEAKWRSNVAKTPVLALATGWEEGSTNWPAAPPAENVSFGFATDGQDIVSGVQLRTSLNASKSVVVVELRELASRAGRPFLENVGAAKSADTTSSRAGDVLDEVQKPLLSLMDIIERQPFDADLYAAQPNTGSYGWHTDSVDNLVICVAGSKNFQIAGTQLGLPPVVNVTLWPGDAVWVPAGTFHKGVGGHEQSLIWSIGFVGKLWRVRSLHSHHPLTNRMQTV